MSSAEKPSEIPFIIAILFGALLGTVCVGASVRHCVRRHRKKGTGGANTLVADPGTVGSVPSVYTDYSFWEWKKGFSRGIGEERRTNREEAHQ